MDTRKTNTPYSTAELLEIGVTAQSWQKSKKLIPFYIAYNMRFLATIAQRDAMIEALTETNKDLGAGYAAEADEADKLHKELMVYRRKLHIMERRARRLYEDWMSELRMRKAREE